MTVLQTIIKNIRTILKDHGLSEDWLHKRTGTAFFLTGNSEGQMGCTAISLLLVAVALNIPPSYLLPGNIKTNSSRIADLSKRKIQHSARSMYRRFWENVLDIAGERNLLLPEIAMVAGLTREEFFLCTIGLDTEIQRIEAISLYLDIPLDILFSAVLEPVMSNKNTQPSKLVAGF